MLEKLLTGLVHKVLEFLLKKIAKEFDQWQKRRLEDRKDKEAVEGLRNAKTKEQKIKHAQDILRGL